MKIAAGQINSKIGDFKNNSLKILNESKRALLEDVALIVFPEMSISGYPPMDLVNYDSFVDLNLESLNWLVSNLPQDIAVCVGYVDYNKKASGKRLDIWWNHGEFSDKEYPENPVDEILAHNPDILIVPSASPFYSGKTTTRLEIVKDICKRGMCSVLYVNMVGANDNLIFDGNSFYTNSNGVINGVAKGFSEELVAKGFSEELIIVDTDTEQELLEPKYSKYGAIENALVLGIKEYISKCGFSKVIIGSSGGQE